MDTIRRTRGSRMVIGLLLTLAMLLAACGGTDNSEATADDQEQESPDEATPTSEGSDNPSESEPEEATGPTFVDTSGGTAAVPDDQLQANETFKLAFFTKNVVNPFWEAGRAGGRAAAEMYGVDVEFFAPTDPDNVAEQTRILEDVIARGAHDGIVIAPVDFTAQVAQIERANDAGIPVFNFSNKMAGGELVCFYGYNDVAIGEGMVGWLADQLGGSGSFAVLEGVPGASTAQKRQEGILAGTPDSGLEMVASQTANYARTEGARVAENLLQSNPDMQAILAHNDEMALGAVAALESAGRDPSEVITVGVDGTPDALKAIEEGRMAASVNYSGYQMGFEATECAVRYLNGEQIEEPDVQLPFEMIDSSNVSEFLALAREIGLMD